MKKGNKMKKGFTPLETVGQSGRNKRLLTGFTLIELITVVIIIAIMAALALPQYTRFIERGQASTAKNALDMIRKAEATYFALNSQYVACTATSGSGCNLAIEVPEVARVFSYTVGQDWQYRTDSATPFNNFTATAARMKGVYTTSSITVTDAGVTTIVNGTSGPSPATIWN